MRRLTEAELARVMAERGYLVCWSFFPHFIGKTLQVPDITDIDSPQPFVVIAETDKTDHDEQLKLIGEAPRDFPFYSYYTESGDLDCQIKWRFYRITTD